MTESLKDTSTAVDLVRLGEPCLQLTRRAAGAGLKNQTASYLAPALGGQERGALEVGGSGVQSQTQLHSGGQPGLHET